MGSEVKTETEGLDDILETISKMEDYGDLMRIATAIKNRSVHLTQAAMQRVKQKFKMGTPIRIKDEKGEYHSGFFYGFTKNKVRFYIYNKEIKINPVEFERQGGEVVE